MGDDAIRSEPPEPPEAQLVEEDEEDRLDVERVRRQDPVETLIPYRNPQGLIAYYAGVFSLIPILGAVLGLVALFLGIRGLRYSKRYPTAGGAGHAIAGIVLGTLTALFNWGIILLIVAGIALSTMKH